MSARLPVCKINGQCRNGLDRNPYAHEDAADRMIGRDAEAIGRAIGLSGRRVRQWRERYDSDHRGPGRTLAMAMVESIRLGRSVADAVEPLRAIIEDACLPYQLAPRIHAVGRTTDPHGQALAALHETVEAAQLLRQALADGRLTQTERRDVKREIRQAVDELLALDSMVDALPEEVAP